MKDAFASMIGVFGAMAVTFVLTTIILFQANSTYAEHSQRRTDEYWWSRGSLGMDPLELTEAPGMARGKEIYGLVCSVCHGENGEGKRLLHAPALHQQEDWYLRAQMKNFREGTRGTHPDDIHGAQMRPVMATLPDAAAYEDLANYIVSLEAPAPECKIEGDLAKGKELYDSVCTECHGSQGEGIAEKNAPAVRGQNDWYLAAQLAKFRDGVRGSHPRDVAGAEMAETAVSLESDELINDVTAYIASMDP